MATFYKTILALTIFTLLHTCSPFTIKDEHLCNSTQIDQISKTLQTAAIIHGNNISENINYLAQKLFKKDFGWKWQIVIYENAKSQDQYTGQDSTKYNCLFTCTGCNRFNRNFAYVLLDAPTNEERMVRVQGMNRGKKVSDEEVEAFAGIVARVMKEEPTNLRNQGGIIQYEFMNWHEHTQYWEVLIAKKGLKMEGLILMEDTEKWLTYVEPSTGNQYLTYFIYS